MNKDLLISFTLELIKSLTCFLDSKLESSFESILLEYRVWSLINKSMDLIKTLELVADESDWVVSSFKKDSSSKISFINELKSIPSTTELFWYILYTPYFFSTIQVFPLLSTNWTDTLVSLSVFSLSKKKLKASSTSLPLSVSSTHTRFLCSFWP